MVINSRKAPARNAPDCVFGIFLPLNFNSDTLQTGW
jgi:hypothetical protein